MGRKSLMAAIAFGLAGLLLAGAWMALPDPAAWRTDDGYLIQEAYRLGPQVAAATFPGWKPGDVPILLTNGRANYLVNPWPGAPEGRRIPVDGLTVDRLDRLVVPVVANAAIPVNGRTVALVTGKEVLEQLLGGLVAELDMVGGGQAALIRGLLKEGSGRRITPEEYVTVILHESFHTYQIPVLLDWWERLGEDETGRELWRTVYVDPENNRLQNEEGQALREAVQAPDAAGVRSAARRFLQARDQRIAHWQTQLGTAKADLLMEWERMYEWQEGLACYIQAETYTVVRSGYHSLPKVARMPGYTGYQDGPETGRAYQINQISQPVESYAPRERTCRLGAGQALILDRLMPGWQERAATGEPLVEMLREAVEK